MCFVFVWKQQHSLSCIVTWHSRTGRHYVTALVLAFEFSGFPAVLHLFHFRIYTCLHSLKIEALFEEGKNVNFYWLCNLVNDQMSSEDEWFLLRKSPAVSLKTSYDKTLVFFCRSKILLYFHMLVCHLYISWTKTKTNCIFLKALIWTPQFTSPKKIRQIHQIHYSHQILYNHQNHNGQMQ